MRLAESTDHALRVLMYCAAHAGRLVTIAEIAEHHRLSKNQLMKIVNGLAQQRLVETTRGRHGGLRLLQPAAEIRIGDVVRRCETDFRLVECFDAPTDRCVLTPDCRLKSVFAGALQAFLRRLDATTLADVCTPGAGGAAPPRPVQLERAGPSATAASSH